MDSINLGIFRLRGDKVIWIIVFLLCLISIAAVYSSSSSLAFSEKKSTMDYLLRQLKFVVFSLTTLFVFYNIPLGIYRMFSYLVMPLSILLLVVTLTSGASYNSADRWIKVFGFTIHTGEIAKIATIMYLSRVMEARKFETFKEFAIWIIAPTGIVILLILYGSISTGLLVTAVTFVMLVVAGIKWMHLLKASLIAISAGALVLLLNLSFGIFPRVETAVNRIKNFATEDTLTSELTPMQRQQILDKTYQANMARIAVASVGVLGKGPGNSTQRNFLPHPYSDFIYAIIIEEWGLLIGGIGVLMLYLWFLARAIIITKKCTTIFSSMLVMGLAILITTQALLHICVNVGLLPVTGHTLPLISLGGTSLMIMGGAFGMILSVSRTVEKGNDVEVVDQTETANVSETENRAKEV
ncbi:MAG: FtsW/RodA/SpoVE family cell cycle protein [Bacteroidales bacterium]|jgi:cell division protein FtsW|nr:FtsW/RodA/SpoVE family cell cycle protein [Bacteroidales bacterium]MDD3299735.1 FtsW/RodA/SpoVE family cell cycle protein [Bacteroidales bacterium]MDD3843341.1 FtsW/RodA/SpoVE family cell cycle protein [Bacteroidales bacterium]MDD4617614.1 FtsW/RodA/SpoVE family cell cycle protein [Bacteroidales bacterium]